MGLKYSLTSLVLAVPLALAHGAHEAQPLGPIEARDLNHCNKQFSKEEFAKRTAEIHGKEFHRLRRNLGLEDEAEEQNNPIHKRSYITVSQVDHRQNVTVTLKTDPSTLFTTAGACIQMPVVDQGPLYVLGEQIRKDNTEGQAGIKMTLAVQVVDLKTCAPVTDAYVDIWSSNSTGIYVGVQGYPGMGDPNDAGMLKGTALRGIQPTDSHGIATFDTLLPGHYDGRATHIHAITYLGATKQPNNTITGGRAAHVGQIYFDQSLLASVDKVSPYNTNTMKVVPNTNDFLFMMGANGDDPIVKYALVGDKLEDGVFGWIRFGINTASSQNVSPAAFMTPSGGIMNPKGPVAKMNGGGMGGGMGGGWGGWGGWGMGGGAGKGKTTPKMKARNEIRERQEAEDDAGDDYDDAGMDDAEDEGED